MPCAASLLTSNLQTSHQTVLQILYNMCTQKAGQLGCSSTHFHEWDELGLSLNNVWFWIRFSGCGRKTATETVAHTHNHNIGQVHPNTREKIFSYYWPPSRNQRVFHLSSENYRLQEGWG